MIRLPVLCERWLTSNTTLHAAYSSGRLPAYMLASKRSLHVSAADALDFMDRVWPEYVTGVPEPDYSGRHWQRLALSDRCAFLLQLRAPVDVALALAITPERVNALVRSGLLRARIRPGTNRFGGRPGGSYAVTAADLIHFLDHSTPVFTGSEDEEVASLRPSVNAVNSTR